MSLEVPSNVLKLLDVPFNHPEDELRYRFHEYAASTNMPKIVMQPLDESALIVFKSIDEARKAKAAELARSPTSRIVFHKALVYESVHCDHTMARLAVPAMKKRWLISPPPSPPEEWQPTTEGLISCVTSIDLPTPVPLPATADGTPVLLLFNQDMSGAPNLSNHTLPTITLWEA